MKKIILLFLYNFLILTNCSNSTNSNINKTWTKENSVVCYGTSLTAVYHEEYDSYPYFLAKKLKINVVNLGHTGATSIYATDHIDEVINENPKLVILEFGANDFLNQYSPQILADNLVLIIDELKDFGCDIALVNFAHPDMADKIIHNQKVKKLLRHFSDEFIEELIQLGLKYDATIDSIANKNNLIYEDYMLEVVDGDSSMIGYDNVHPNRDGNQQIADNIFATLKDYFKENKMLD